VRLARFSRVPAGPSSGAEAARAGSVIEFGVVPDGPVDDATDVVLLSGDPAVGPVRPVEASVRLGDVRLLAPVLPRSKVVGVGRNYAEHARELGNDVPPEPLLFLKPNTSVVGPGHDVVVPAASQEVHYEAELAVIIGRVCKDVPAQRVADVVLGYTCANDVTARDLQRSDGQWARAKGFDTFCPLGPWVETALDPADVAITCTVNGELRQAGRTSQMVHDVASLVAFVSSVFTLLPGDVILTGTPAGVGPMRPGDDLEVTVEGIGTLQHGVVAPASAAAAPAAGPTSTPRTEDAR